MAKLVQIVVDCEHPAALARFWAAALDEFEVRAYDAAEVARLADLGFTPETDPVVLVDGPGLEVCFQRVDVAARTKNRVHLDIAASDPAAEIQRLVALGATIRQSSTDHAWMVDPEGNDFCVVALRAALP